MCEGKNTVILIDLDGILVDNTDFEESVTCQILEHIAKAKNISTHMAAELWHKSLHSERESVKWYDYDAHCANLGVTPIAKKAHEYAIDKLREVPGARKTWDLLRCKNIEIYVTSDAARWVIEFKMRLLGFDGYTRLFSSQEIGAPKNSDRHWLILKSEIPENGRLFLIDNRIDNLVAAKKILRRLICIYFRQAEHATAFLKKTKLGELPDSVSESYIITVRDHSELRSLLMKLIGNLDG